MKDFELISKDYNIIINFNEQPNKKVLKKALTELKVKDIDDVIKEIYMRIRYYSRINYLEKENNKLWVWYRDMSEYSEENCTSLYDIFDNE